MTIPRTIAHGSKPAWAGATIAMTGTVEMHSNMKVAGNFACPRAIAAKLTKMTSPIAPVRICGA